MYSVIQKCKLVSLTILFITIGVAAPVGYAQTASAAVPRYCLKSPADCGIVAETGGDCTNINQCDLINTYINPFVDFLTALVGVGVVISIIVGGIQYTTSAGDPSKVSAAKARIRNAIIALIAFLLLYGLLNFLIPGGLV